MLSAGTDKICSAFSLCSLGSIATSLLSSFSVHGRWKAMRDVQRILGVHLPRSPTKFPLRPLIMDTCITP